MAQHSPTDIVRQASTMSIVWGVLLIIFGMVAIRLDSRCMRSSLVIVMFYHSGRKALRNRPLI